MFKLNRESGDAGRIRHDAESSFCDRNNGKDSQYCPVASEAAALSTLAAGRFVWRLLTIWDNRVGMAVVLITALFGLSWFATDVSRQGQEPDMYSAADVVLIERIEVRRVWLPGTLIALARHQSRSPMIRDHRELQQFLEFQNLEHLSYAITIRMYTDKGKFAECTCIRYPYEQSCHLGELMNVLATAAGNRPPRFELFDWDWSNAFVRVVPEDSWNRSPRHFVVQQLGDPSPPGDQELYP